MNNRVAVWFRNDLRLDDHEPLTEALRSQPSAVVCIYVLDPFWFGETRDFHFPRTGAFRARFLFESLADLRSKLQAQGQDLMILRGDTAKCIRQACQEHDIGRVYYHAEAASEEIQIEQQVGQLLSQNGIGVKSYWGSTLFHRDDLPFSVAKLPPVFTQFRVACEKSSKIRPPLPSPEQWVLPPRAIEFGPLPTLAEFGLEIPVDDKRGVMRFHGGETAAFHRMEHYFWQSGALGRYKLTRNGMLGADYSSKFSAWLAHGCISPRRIAAEVAQFEQDRVRNDSTYWLVFELIWRDYFRFLALQAGDRLFYRSGPRRVQRKWRFDRDAFELWRTGQTGVPFVDANMRELLLTGFQSNRGRQNVASFLVKNLGMDWRAGAEWFESQLIDFDVCANWGNWAYVAGVGNDPRGDRYFHVIKQARDYDPNGAYAKTWLPELESLSSDLVHEPWKIDEGGQLNLNFGFQYGRDYPRPMIDLESSYRQIRAESSNQASAQPPFQRKNRR